MRIRITTMARLFHACAAVMLVLLGAPVSAHSQRLVVQDRTRVLLTSKWGHSIQSISAIVALRESAVAVEGETNTLVVLGFDGAERFRLPNTGPGAAMLAHPVDATLSGQADVLVLDAQVPRLARFALRGDSLTVSSVVRLRGMTGVSALCSMAERAFVLGIALPAASSELVHRVGQDGEVQSSFGEAFGPPGEVSRILFGTGRLLCLPQEQLIVVASQYFPEVRAYDVRGTLRWRQQLPDFRRVSYRESASRVDYTYPPDSIWDQTVSVFPANDQLLAVQVGRRYGRNPSAPFREVRTLLISMGDGRLIRAQTDLPVVKAAGRGRLFSIDNDGSLSILSYMIR